jgi:hypothetical protein
MQVGDVTRRRRGLDGRDPARKGWYARHRQWRFARRMWGRAS